jgi:hypothetical protein
MLSTLLIDVRDGARARNGEVVERVLKIKQTIHRKFSCNYWKVRIKLREAEEHANYWGLQTDELFRRSLRSLRKSLTYKQMCGKCTKCVALFIEKGLLNV